MGNIDVLFLHVSRLNNYYRLINQFTWINFLPMGFPGLADALHREGI